MKGYVYRPRILKFPSCAKRGWGNCRVFWEGGKKIQASQSGGGCSVQKGGREFCGGASHGTGGPTKPTPRFLGSVWMGGGPLPGNRHLRFRKLIKGGSLRGEGEPKEVTGGRECRAGHWGTPVSEEKRVTRARREGRAVNCKTRRVSPWGGKPFCRG